MTAAARASRPSRARPLVQGLAIIGLLLATRRARAEQAYELRHDTAADIGVTVGGFGFVAFTEVMKPALAPEACRWCDRNAAGEDTLNGLDRAGRGLVWAAPKYAAATSDVSAFLATPIAAFGGVAAAASAARQAQHFPRDALLIAECAAVAGIATQLVKFSVARARPSTHDRNALHFSGSADQNLSFPSGHTSLAFALATGAGTIASLRGYEGAPFVWVATLPIATLTAYLRVAANKHYVTDVTAGMVLGVAAGLVVPLAFHGREPATPNAPGAQRAAVVPTMLTFTW